METAAEFTRFIHSDASFIEALLQWGLNCIILIQSYANPLLTNVMRIITELGSPAVYIILLPLIYWCINEKKGLRLGIMLLVSLWLNLLLKYLLNQPRPFFDGYDPSVGMIQEKLGGFPSGHAQNSLVFWMIIASWSKKSWPWFAAAVFCLLIGFSRVYLGVHFPTDVLGGWLIGGILITIYFVSNRRIEQFLWEKNLRTGLSFCAALAFAMILYQPSVELLIPGAALLGLGCGYGLCKHRIGFTALSNRTGFNKFITLLVRFLLGMTVFALLYVLTGKIIINMNSSANFRLIIFLRFALLTLWVSAGAPWIFRLLRLTEPETPDNVR